MAETSGLVQRLKWSQDAKTVYIYLGPLPTAVQLFWLTLDSSDPADLAFGRTTAHLLIKAMSAGLPVTLFYDQNQGVITGADVRFSEIRPEGIEITQAIQDLVQSVPLVALKTTVARVYLSTRSNVSINVRGE